MRPWFCFKKPKRSGQRRIGSLLTCWCTWDSRGGEMDDGLDHPIKETEIGLLPQEWEVQALDELTIQVGSGVTPRGGRESYLAQGVPLIRSQNVLMNKL